MGRLFSGCLLRFPICNQLLLPLLVSWIIEQVREIIPHILVRTEIDQAAQHRLDTMMPQLMKQRGITEKLKSRDPMCWVAEMNAAKAQVEEVIFTELVYA